MSSRMGPASSRPPGIGEVALPPLGNSTSYLPPVTEPIHLVVRLRQRRVYVYRGTQALANYPIAIGKAGWETPRGTFQVLNMEQNPVYKSFKTGAVIQPGPNNPLGVRWIGIWTDGKTQIGFHGTNQEELIGKAISHGCIRMRNRDVVAIYNQVQLGTVVKIEP